MLAPVSVGDGIAALALVFSAYAAVTTTRFNARQRKLIEGQDRLNAVLLARETAEASEAKRADLGASFIKLGSNNYRLKVWNKGKAAARHVRLEFPEGNDCLIPSDIAAKFPMELLEPHQSVELIAAVSMDTKSKHPMQICWDDDTREGNQKMIYPTI